MECILLSRTALPAVCSEPTPKPWVKPWITGIYSLLLYRGRLLLSVTFLPTPSTHGPPTCAAGLFQFPVPITLVSPSQHFPTPLFTPQGSFKIQYHSNGPDAEPVEIDFTPPWRRISMISGLEELLNVKMPTDLDSPEARKMLVRGGGGELLYNP